MSGYLTLNKQTEIINVIERSKFICVIKPIENEEQAKEFVEKISKTHSLATHNCYAYIADELGLKQKFSDDGEPQGTAGLPMLNALKNSRLKKVVAVVTRYFGGIKLGTGGLARAYGSAVIDCVNNAQIIDMQEVAFCKISLDYEGYSKLNNILTRLNIPVTDTVFENEVALNAVIKLESDKSLIDFQNKIADAFNGKEIIKNITLGFYSFKVKNG